MFGRGVQRLASAKLVFGLCKSFHGHKVAEVESGLAVSQKHISRFLCALLYHLDRLNHCARDQMTGSVHWNHFHSLASQKPLALLERPQMIYHKIAGR